MPGEQLRRRLGPHPGEEDAAVGAQHPLHDGFQVLRPLPLGVDGLGQAVAQLAMEVQLGEPEVGVRELGEVFQGRLGGDLPGGHGFQETLKLLGIQLRSAPPRRYP